MTPAGFHPGARLLWCDSRFRAHALPAAFIVQHWPWLIPSSLGEINTVMTSELWLLVASIILGLVHLIAASHLISFQHGYRWTASSREEPVPPLRGLANRVDQATTNFLETFPFFAALVLVAHVTQHHSLLTLWGAHLYFWARLGIFRCGGRICSAAFAFFWNTALSRAPVFFLVALSA